MTLNTTLEVLLVLVLGLVSSAMPRSILARNLEEARTESGTTLRLILRELQADGVATRVVECGTFAWQRLPLAECLLRQLTGNAPLSTKAGPHQRVADVRPYVAVSYLKADLPNCIYTKSIYGVGLLFAPLRPYRKGPATPHDSYSSDHASTPCRREFTAERYATARFSSFGGNEQLQARCRGLVRLQLPAVRPPSAQKCLTFNVRHRMKRAFISRRGQSCSCDDWKSASSMQREYVRLLAARGQSENGFLGLYNEYTLAHGVDEIHAVFYLNGTGMGSARLALLNARKLAWQIVSHRRAQKAILKPLPHTRNETAFGIDAVARDAIPAAAPVLEATRSPPVIQFRPSEECWSAHAVLARQAQGLLQPAGAGFLLLASDQSEWENGSARLMEQLVRL